MAEKSVLIVGGGVIGLFSALYLNESGHKVTIVDTGEIAGYQACSWGNAGMIVPSHFIPLANKSALRQAIKSKFSSHSPIGLKISLSRDFLNWMYLFQKSAFSKHISAKQSILAKISLESRSLYSTLQEKYDIPMSLSLSGIQMICRTSETFEQEKKAALKAKKYDIPTQVWTKDEFDSQNPLLKANIKGAVFYPLDGILDPYPMQKSLISYLKSKGVEFHGHNKISKFIVEGQKIVSVVSDHNTFSAQKFLLATGDISPRIVQHLGLSIPILPGKGISYQLKSNGPIPSIPSLLQDEHVAITPYQNHVRVATKFNLGDRSENFSNHDLMTVNQSIQKTIRNWDLGLPDQENVWYGFRPVSPDGLPLIGKSQSFSNLTIATGHAMIGISLAPVTGRIISQIINDSKKLDNKDLELLNPGRFGNKF